MNWFMISLFPCYLSSPTRHFRFMKSIIPPDVHSMPVSPPAWKRIVGVCRIECDRPSLRSNSWRSPFTRYPPEVFPQVFCLNGELLRVLKAMNCARSTSYTRFLPHRAFLNIVRNQCYSGQPQNKNSLLKIIWPQMPHPYMNCRFISFHPKFEEDNRYFPSIIIHQFCSPLLYVADSSHTVLTVGVMTI